MAVKEKKEEFISLQQLARRKHDTLTRDQRALLEHRDHAVEMARALKRFRTSPELDAHVIDRQRRALPLEQEAQLASRRALIKAVEYYAKHGRITQAYDDLQIEVSKWHPHMNKLWANEFDYSAARVSAKIPPALAVRIAAEKKLEAPFARKLGKRIFATQQEEEEEAERPLVKN